MPKRNRTEHSEADPPEPIRNRKASRRRKSTVTNSITGPIGPGANVVQTGVHYGDVNRRG